MRARKRACLSRLGCAALTFALMVITTPGTSSGDDSAGALAGFLSGVIGGSPITEGFQAAFRYMGNSASDDDHHGDFDELQGIANGPNHWYFSRNVSFTFGEGACLYRVAYSEHLAHDFARELKWVQFKGTEECDHIGDIDYFSSNGEGYIVAAFNSCWPQEGAYLAIFRESDFSLPGLHISPCYMINVTSVQGTQAPWVCVGPAGHLYSGSGKVSGKENEVYEYTVSWDVITQGGGATLDSARTIHLLTEESAPFIVEHWQGADFSSDGSLFYFVNGMGGADVFEGATIYHGYGFGSIHVFQVCEGKYWKCIRASAHKTPPFRFEVNDEEEPEGCSYFDMRSIEEYHQDMPLGELHVILLNNDAGNDNVWIKHYTSVIDVQAGEELDGTFYCKWGEGVWDGSVLKLESGTYRGPLVLEGRHVLVTSSNGPAVIGED
jgi:hypothetical protein